MSGPADQLSDTGSKIVVSYGPTSSWRPTIPPVTMSLPSGRNAWPAQNRLTGEYVFGTKVFVDRFQSCAPALVV